MFPIILVFILRESVDQSDNPTSWRNMNSLNGSRLPPNSMTLDDLKHQNKGFNGFFGDFGLRDTFQERSAPNSLQIDQDKTRWMKWDFNRPSINLLGSRKPAHEGIKERYPIKVVILPLLASLKWKRLQIGLDMLPITTSPSDELFSRINIDNSERPWTPKIRSIIVFCNCWLCRALQEWIATKWLETD